MTRMVQFARDHQVLLVHDFAYADLGFDGYDPPSLLQVPGAEEVGVEIYSLTKSFSMAGWRVGFMLGNAEVVGALARLKSYLDYGTFQPIQIASIVAMNEAPDYPRGERGVPRPARRAVRRPGAHSAGTSRSPRGRCSSGPAAGAVRGDGQPRVRQDARAGGEGRRVARRRVRAGRGGFRAVRARGERAAHRPGGPGDPQGPHEARLTARSWSRRVGRRGPPGTGRVRRGELVAYWILKIVLTPILHLVYRIRIEGKEHLPKKGAVILASNHRSFLDSIFIPLVVGRRVTFVAKAEYFDDPKTAWFFRAVGQIPIRREGGSASEGALAAATDVLEAGGVFGIYPEGTRTRDGYLHKGKTGVARLALSTGAPIVPVGLVGTDECQPTDAKLPRLFRKLTIRFGPPLSMDHYAGREHDRLVLRQITDELMFEIGELCGYEYRDTYAGKSDVPGGHDFEDKTTEVAKLAS